MDNDDQWSFRAEDWHSVSLHYRCDKVGLTCYVAGDFCGWRENEWLLMKEGEEDPGLYSIGILLLEGCYQYKFVVDGRWQRDPCNHYSEACFGNSLLFVGDFDRRVAGEGVVERLARCCPVPVREYRRDGSHDGREFQVITEQDLTIPENLVERGVLGRPVFVYLPPGYFEDEERTYPVLYALDGQNVFSTSGYNAPNHGGWWLDSQLDLLVADNATEPFILVAVPNGDAVSQYPLRKREYCPSNFDKARWEPFTRYLVDVVKSEIDTRYRTRRQPESTAVLGASLAGLYAFTLLVFVADVFGKAICMSPSFWYYDQNNISIYDIIRKKFLVEKDFEQKRQLYLHVGDGDGDNTYETKEMALLLQEVGENFAEGRDFCFDYDCGRRNECEGGNTHSEAVWRHRLHFGLRFILPLKSGQ